jgi:hypothetical protein
MLKKAVLNGDSPPKTGNLRKKVDQSFGIDSMRLRIPVKNCNRISSELYDNKLIVSETTGEIEDTRTNQRKAFNSLTFQAKEAMTGFQSSEPCVIISVPAKGLEDQYFEGINKSNFNRIFSQIISSGLVDISEDAFYNSALCSDIDIKKDFYFGESGLKKQFPVFVDYCKALKHQAKPTKAIGRGVKVYNSQKQGQGIQFGTRSQSSISYPFLKLYNKEIELNTRAADFSSRHLSGSNYEGVIRAEATIKNADHMKRIVIDSEPVLLNVLGFTQNELRKFFQHAWNVHINQTTALPKKIEKMTGSKQIIYNSISVLGGLGLDRYEIETALLKDMPNRMSLSRYRKIFRELYSLYESTKKQPKNVIDSIFD